MNANEDRPVWHEQDAFWEGTADVQFSEEVWEDAPQEVTDVLALAGLESPLRVLDMPCGVGRHTLEFARRGCAVTGIDRTASYLAQAQEKLAEANLDAELIEADMRAYRQPAAFDLAINLYTSFGYFEDPDDDLKVLTNFYESLRPGGILVMHLMGKEVLARIFDPRDWHELDDGSLMLKERRVCRDWTWIENRWIIISPEGERREYPLAHRVYGASDLRNALMKTGFAAIQVYGSLSGTPYDHTARRLVMVARKPDSA